MRTMLQRIRGGWVVALMVPGLLLAAASVSAEDASLNAALKGQGYVSVPFTQATDRNLYVEGKIHGSELTFMLDMRNEDSLYDLRALKGLGVEFEKTEIVVPTRTKNVRIHTGQITGIEFAGKSTGAMLVHAGDVDPMYNIKPGTDGPDVVLGVGFLKKYDALVDFKNKLVHLRFR